MPMNTAMAMNIAMPENYYANEYSYALAHGFSNCGPWPPGGPQTRSGRPQAIEVDFFSFLGGGPEFHS